MLFNTTKQHVNTELDSITLDNVHTVKNTPLSSLTVSLHSNGTTRNVDYYQIKIPKPRLLSRLPSEKEALSEMRIAFDATLNDIATIKAGKEYVGSVNLKHLDNKHSTHNKGQANVRIIVTIQSHDEATHTLNYKIDIPSRCATFTRYRPSRKHPCDFDSGSFRMTNIRGKPALITAERYASHQNYKNHTVSSTFVPAEEPTTDDDIFYDALSEPLYAPIFSQLGEATTARTAIAGISTNASRIMSSAYSMTNDAAHYLGQTLTSAIDNTYHTLTDAMTSVHRYVVKSSESDPEFHIEASAEDDDQTVVHSNLSPAHQSTYIADAIELAGHFFTNALTVWETIYQTTTRTATTAMASVGDMVENMADAIGTGLDCYEEYNANHF